MFRMYGRKVEILKYSISYVENDEQKIEYAATEEEANEISKRVNGTIIQLKTENDVWMDGIEVDDVPNTREAALEIYQMGEEDYLAMKAKPTDEQRIVALESALVALMKMNMNMGE